MHVRAFKIDIIGPNLSKNDRLVSTTFEPIIVLLLTVLTLWEQNCRFHANSWGLVFAAPLTGCALVLPGKTLLVKGYPLTCDSGIAFSL